MELDAAALRRQMMTIRDCMSIGETEQYSASIDEKLYAYIDEHPRIRSVLCFYPKGNEVALLPLYERLGGMYRLYFPVTTEERIVFYAVDDLTPSAFSPGRYAIMEPRSKATPFPADSHEAEATVAIVPGLGFDPVTRGRIGYGKGYYDRFFAAHPGIFRIGVCYDFQLLDALPQHEGDVAMDMLVTNAAGYE